MTAGVEASEEYGWVSTLMLAVAVCERIPLLAELEAETPLRDALSNHAVQLRDLAQSEVDRQVPSRSEVA